MIVKRVVKNRDGTLDVSLMLTGEQAAFLMNVGLGALVQRGVVTLQDFSPEEFEQHMKELAEAEADQMADEQPSPAPTQPEPAGTTVTPVEPSQESMKNFLESVDVDLLHKA